MKNQKVDIDFSKLNAEQKNQLIEDCFFTIVTMPRKTDAEKKSIIKDQLKGIKIELTEQEINRKFKEIICQKGFIFTK